jgi:hypothetical protein
MRLQHRALDAATDRGAETLARVDRFEDLARRTHSRRAKVDRERSLRIVAMREVAAAQQRRGRRMGQRRDMDVATIGAGHAEARTFSTIP